jgi:predicted DsbA family dithiol-disulfide isomerase
MDKQSRIQVVSDVVCPWCYIGKRRLERALDLLGRKDIQPHWTAFQLNPSAPPGGWNRREYRIAKFGSAEVSARLEARVLEAGAREGIEFRFDRIEKTPNTFDAHRLIWLGGREARQDAIVEALFRAYFIDGRNIGDRAVLRNVADEAGLERESVSALFAGNLGTDEVTRDETEARAHGVSVVPTFFVNGEALTSGAQPPELLAAALATSLPAGACAVHDPNC